MTTLDDWGDIGSNEIVILFSHLDRKDEIVIDLYHDSERERPHIDGRILEHKELGPIYRGEIGTLSKSANFLASAAGLVVALVIIGVVVVVFLAVRGYLS